MFENFEKYTTLMYRPPEMIDKYLKFKVDTKVDIWMLGCLIFILCFKDDPFLDQKLAKLNAQYRIPKDTKVSSKMQDLIHLLLVPDPND